MRLMIGMVLACGLVIGTAGDASAQDITFKGWAADGRAVLAIDDPFDMYGSGMESFGAVCWGSPVDSVAGLLATCAPCDGDACAVKKKARKPKAKSPNRKIKVKTKRKCVRGADGKECTHSITVGKLGKFVHNEGPAYMKAKMKVYFRADSKAAVVIFKANNPESGSGEDAVYILDLEPVPEVPEYEEPPDWDDPCGNY
jgi:hypothetical protein